MDASSVRLTFLRSLFLTIAVLLLGVSLGALLGASLASAHAYADGGEPGSGLAAGGAHAIHVMDGDNQALPQATSVAILNEGSTVTKPGKLYLRLGLKNTDMGIRTIGMRLTSESDSTKELYHWFYFGHSQDLNGDYATYSPNPVYDSSCEIEYPIPATAQNGQWRITSITVEDGSDHTSEVSAYNNNGVWMLRSSLDPSDEGFESPAITVRGEQGDETAPVVTSLQVLNPQATVNKPGTLNLRVGIREEGSGVDQVIVHVTNESGKSLATHTLWYLPTSERPNSDEGITYLDEPLRTGFYDIPIPISAAAHNGQWRVSWVFMTDLSTNRYEAHAYSYTNWELQGMQGMDSVNTGVYSPAFTVSGAQGDEDAPAITSLQILNPDATVAKPGVLRVRVGIREDGSGVHSICLYAESESGESKAEWLAQYAPEMQGQVSDFCTYLKAPLHTGTYDMNIPITANAHNGQWRIAMVTMDDMANNALDARAFPENNWQFRESPTYDVDLGVQSPAFTVKDEFKYAFSAALSNPRLVLKLSSLAEGDAAHILIDGNQVLPKAAFDAIRGHDRTIVAYKGGIQWIFNGKDVVWPSKDVNLSVSIATVPGSQLSSGKQAVSCTFAPNGVLPGKAQVRFKNDYLYTFNGVKGQLRLYYVDGNRYTQEGGNLDLVFDGTDKWCYMDVTHNSKFLVSAYALKPFTMKQAAIAGIPKSYAYNGKARVPNVRVKLGGKTLAKGKDYTVALKGNKAVGTATVTVKGKGAYSNAGSVKRTFTIVPKATALTKVEAGKAGKAGKGSVRVAWKAVAKKDAKQAGGYQVRYSVDKKFSKGVKMATAKGAAATSKAVKNLKAKKRYYFQVRVFKKVGKKTYYSAWSKSKSVKV